MTVLPCKSYKSLKHNKDNCRSCEPTMGKTSLIFIFRSVGKLQQASLLSLHDQGTSCLTLSVTHLLPSLVFFEAWFEIGWSLCVFLLQKRTSSICFVVVRSDRNSGSSDVCCCTLDVLHRAIDRLPHNWNNSFDVCMPFSLKSTTSILFPEYV